MQFIPLVSILTPLAIFAATADSPYCDLHEHYPWLPEKPAAITPGMTATMKAFTAAYRTGDTRPSGRGISADKVKSAETLVAGLGLKRAPDGRVTADAPYVYNGEHGLPKNASLGARDFLSTIAPALHQLRALYGSAKKNSPEAAALEEPIRLCLEYVAERDWNATDHRELWVGNGYTILHQSPGHDLLALAHLLREPAQRIRLAENVWWMFDGSCTLTRSPALSTDSLRNTIPQVFAGVAALPDGPEKWQRLLTLRRALDHSVVVNDYNLVTPDGAIIHHGGHHDHYAHYSFVPLADAYIKLAACGLPGEHAAEINRRFRLAGYAWAMSTLPERVAPNLMQRVKLPYADEPRPSGAAGRTDFAIAAAKLAAVSGGPAPETDRELAGLVLALNPASAPRDWKAAWDKAGYKAELPEVCLSLPAAGAMIHRRAGWAVVVRGQNRFLRAGEGTGQNYRYGQWGVRNTYGGRFGLGSLFIADEGDPLNPADSGWVADGFDYSRIPGTTGAVADPAGMVGSLFGTDAALGGGCALDRQGVWAFAPKHLRKSCFLVDDRITFVTSGVTHGKKGRTTTSVFLAAESQPRPMLVDGAPAPESGELRLPGDAPHTLLDGRSRGYFFHPGGDDLTLSRGVREWTYCEPRWFKQTDPAIKLVHAADRDVLVDTRLGEVTSASVNKGAPAQLESAAKLAHFTPSRHRYSGAGYEHAKPGAVDTFTLLMKSDAGKLAAFATAMASANPPVTVKTGPAAHTFADAATGYRGTCLFVGGDIPASLRAGAVSSVSRPCTLMEHPVGPALDLAVASTDIADKSPFVIRVEGRWAVENPPADAKLEADAAHTTITLPFRDMTERRLRLRRP